MTNANSGRGRETLLRLRAFAVHAMTASGAVVALLALLAAAAADFRVAALWMLLALVIDGLDGTLARRFDVKRYAALLDGRRLDDIIDYLNYVVVPVFFLTWSGQLEQLSVAAAVLLAGAFGFARVEAKTRDNFFLGFPSYFNVAAIYLWLFGVNAASTASWLLALSLAVFVPLRYVALGSLQRFVWPNRLGAIAWALLMALVLLAPARAERFFLLELSLLYPAWYLLMSFRMGGFEKAPGQGGAAPR